MVIRRWELVVAAAALICATAAAEEPAALQVQIFNAQGDPVWSLHLRPGETAVCSVQVTNATDWALPEVKLLVSPPPGWTAQLQADRLEALAARESRFIHLEVHPPWTPFERRGKIAVEANAGPYYARDGFSLQARPPRAFWPGIGAGLVAAFGALFVVLFVRINRGGRNRQDSGGPR